MSLEAPVPAPDLLPRYLAEIQTHPLLTAEEEAAYGRRRRLAARRLARRLSLLEALLGQRAAAPAEAGRGAGHPGGSAELEARARELLEVAGSTSAPRITRLADGLRRDLDELADAREVLARSQLRFVVFIARRHLASGFPLLDLIQEGNVGLMKAVENFDERRGTRLATYAAWWIRQAMQRAILQSHGPLTIPVKLDEQRRRMVHATRDLRFELGREPTREELSQCLQESVDTVESLARLAADQRAGLPLTPENLPLRALMDTDSSCPIREVQLRELREELGRSFRVLRGREKMVIRLRYGFASGGGQTLDEIGRQLRLSRERIRQIERDAIGKLRRRQPLARIGESLSA
jgi:RNA polymerase sigma factor (sigma-70 family)